MKRWFRSKTRQAEESSHSGMEGLIPGKEGIEAFLHPEERHKLNRMVLLSRYVVEGNLAGAHRSPLRGASSEFADHKAYGLGDDPKHIDWRVLARTDRYFVKRFEDETNLRVYLVVDRSASMGYGSAGISKYLYACRLAAALGYVVVKARDSVGLCLHADTVTLRMGARNSIQHLHNMCKQLQSYEPDGGSAIAEALHEIAGSVRRRAMVVVLSDLLGDEKAVQQALGRLRRQRHDVIVLQILDPVELDLKIKQPHIFKDLESGETIQASPREIIDAYQKVFAEFVESYRTFCASLRIDHRVVRTDEPVDLFTRAYLQERRRLTA